MASLPPLLSIPSLAVIAIIIPLAGYILYRAALPKPLPGIPYHAASAGRILGDIPDAISWQNERKEFWSFLQDRCKQLQSPIVQVFMQPFGKPWVILADYRESQDMMVRRGKEFDRSGFLGDLFKAIAPNNHVGLPTGNEWKAHRRLMADTMSNPFLHDVAAPLIYSSALVTLDLWKEKTRLAPRRAFSVTNDVFKGAMDALWAATFGSDISTAKMQLGFLADLDSISLPADPQMPAEFPLAKEPEAFTSLLMIADSVEYAVKSPLPVLTHWLAVNAFPSLRKAVQRKNDLLQSKLDESWERFSQSDGSSDDIRHALDLIVQREWTMAKKEGREAQYKTPVIEDELLGFLLAGNETTSTTICWGLKLLGDHQQVQQNLRSKLFAKYTRAAEANEMPSVEEIVKSSLPYLDATIEEILRCGAPVPGNSRRALVDTSILGHVIPKGSDILMLQNGAGYVEESLPIYEHQRSKSSIDAKDTTGSWDDADISAFKPERWLVSNEGHDGMKFDPKAGPAQAFGAGQRGCFGKKLANLTLKIFFTLIVWKYELQPPPPAYSSYLGRDKSTHQPQYCYLRFTDVKSA